MTILWQPEYKINENNLILIDIQNKKKYKYFGVEYNLWEG